MSIDWLGPVIFGAVCAVGITVMVIDGFRFERRMKLYEVAASQRREMIEALLWYGDSDLMDSMWQGQTLRRHVNALERGRDWHDAYPDDIWPAIHEYEVRVARSKITVVK